MARETWQQVQKDTYTNYNRQYVSSTKPDVVTETTADRVSYYKAGYRDSTVTPGFHNPNRKGRLKPRAFTFSEEENYAFTGRRSRKTTKLQPGQYGYFEEVASGPANTSSTGISGIEWPSGSRVDKTPPTNLDSRARNGLLLKIKSSAVNLGVMGAERKKTAAMVGNTAMNLVNAMRNLRRGNFSGAAEDLGVPPKKRARSRFNKAYAKDSARAVGGGWLALQYGWKPLLTDIYGSCEALARRNDAPMYVTTTKSATSVTPFRINQVSKSQDLVSGEFWAGAKLTVVKYGVTYYRPQSVDSSLSQLGITNPALIAWELVPYSFVVDWFLPIGDWLGTFDATVGLTFYSGYRTVYSSSSIRYMSTRQGTYSNYTDDWLRTAQVSEVFVQRVPLTGFPSPAIPRFKNPVSVGHMQNALALLTQSFKR